jgi:hypothetical protein
MIPWLSATFRSSVWRANRKGSLTTTFRVTRRRALQRIAAAGLAAPLVFRAYAAAPSETVYHASFGANGMAWADIGSLSRSKHLQLVAVAEVDLNRIAEVKKKFPKATIHQDWRELLDKEKRLNSVNVSTPDHMHAPITMRAMQQVSQGLGGGGIVTSPARNATKCRSLAGAAG